MINTQGLAANAVLAALYNASKPLGFGVLHFTPEDMTLDEAGKLLEHYNTFDYLKGRVMRVDLVACDDEFDEWGYDSFNGEGAAQRAIRGCSQSKTTSTGE